MLTLTAQASGITKRTTTGKIELCITNKAVIGQLKPGKKYYVDFTEIEEPAVAK